MIKTLIMLALICFLATLMMADFILVIPKFASKHFGAPDDIKEMMGRLPDKPAWVNLFGVCAMVAGFIGVIAIFVWASLDIVDSGMDFWHAFIRFLILTEGYKLFDILCFDYLMLYKLKLPARIYPETAGAKGYDSFGFNAKSQVIKLFVFFWISLIGAFLLTEVLAK